MQAVDTTVQAALTNSHRHDGSSSLFKLSLFWSAPAGYEKGSPKRQSTRATDCSVPPSFKTVQRPAPGALHLAQQKDRNEGKTWRRQEVHMIIDPSTGWSETSKPRHRHDAGFLDRMERDVEGEASTRCRFSSCVSEGHRFCLRLSHSAENVEAATSEKVEKPVGREGSTPARQCERVEMKGRPGAGKRTSGVRGGGREVGGR